MTSDTSHVDFARNNDELSEEFRESFKDQNNWTVTMHFYTYLHYVEQVLENQGYTSKSHKTREDNIKTCSYIDREGYKIYRSLYDTSRDARYECIEIEDSSVDECRDRLDKGKEVLGFTEDGGSTKYST
jgi:hypothetical protein